MNRVLCFNDLGVCDCARCDRLCLGEQTQLKLADIPKYMWPPRALEMPVVAGRRNGRPYCAYCLSIEEIVFR